MTAPESLPREKGSAEPTLCLTCGEPLTATGEPAEDGSATFEPHTHDDAQSEQAAQSAPREQGTVVPSPGSTPEVTTQTQPGDQPSQGGEA